MAQLRATKTNAKGETVVAYREYTDAEFGEEYAAAAAHQRETYLANKAADLAKENAALARCKAAGAIIKGKRDVVLQLMFPGKVRVGIVPWGMGWASNPELRKAGKPKREGSGKVSLDKLGDAVDLSTFDVDADD